MKEIATAFFDKKLISKKKFKEYDTGESINVVLLP